MNSTSGIIHNSGVDDSDLVHLPLEEVRANVVIIDISAKVTLSQVFSNPSEHATSQALYHFPVPASAAICAFEMKLSDGRIIRGESKDSKLAAEEYNRAISEGREASLLKWISDDIFTISIGSIPARQTVETKLVFVMDLMNENTDQIRFHLPMHVGQRYGEIPQELIGSAQPSSRTRVKITVDVQTSGRILNIQSPTHSGEITTTQYPTHLNRPSRRRATIKYRAKSFLNRDYILVIEAENLDSPRCFAELEGDPDRKASLALQLAIVPKFNLVSARAQEYIFVVDRSGSMAGNRIETAKRTLGVLLHMLPLPTDRTYFNIFSFGSSSDCLWDGSQMYHQRPLEIATSHVDLMEANYGGTEIFDAMDNVLKSRRLDIATAIFLLTDGGSHDVDRTSLLVQNATNSAPLSAPLRVYVLGIGDEVSTAMCEGIARAGNGVCLYALQAEEITSKCARLLRAGRTPFIRNVTIDWGLPEEYLESSSNSVSFSSSQRPTRLKSFPVLQQAPTEIDDIHAGIRFTVYAILRLKQVRVPEEVVLRGNLDDTGEPFQFRVPIRGVQLTRSEPGNLAIHTMAAWYLIKEHESGRAPLPMYLPVPNVSPTNEELREAAIIRLGETYQLASRYTSFVAVDSGRDMDRRREHHTDFGNWSHDLQTSRSSSQGRASSPSATSPLSALYAEIVSGLGSILASTNPTTTMPGEWPEDPSPPPLSRPDDGYESSDSVQTFSTLSSFLGSNSEWSDWSEEPSSPVSSEMERKPPPLLIPMRFAPSHMQSTPPPHLPRPSIPLNNNPPPLSPEVVNLVKMQQFDGSYQLDDDLRLLAGDAAFNEFTTLRVDEKAWATALSIAYITKQMGNQRELLQDLLQKGLEFLRGGNNENLIQRATSLI